MALFARRLALQRQLLARGGSTAQIVPRRFMSGGHGHAQQEYTGAEAFVRKYLPENHHMVMGYLGLATFLGLLARSGGSKKEEEAAPASSGSSDATIPSILDEANAKWFEDEANVKKWEAWFEDEKAVKEWEASLQ
mmetsp:Transcript_8309/g.26013  ORF Transcript_8309/g.26013 Transcript_8309/m.26013 type:complete len:136 (+) Transcript_8309:27-434(+)